MNYELNKDFYEKVFNSRYSSMFGSSLTIEQTQEIENIMDQIQNKQIPKEYPKYMFDMRYISSYPLRSAVIERMGFVLLSEKWLKPLAGWIGNRRCLEVMSGTGSLSYGLKQYGVNIKATDNFSWGKENPKAKFNNYWTDIENIDAIEAVNKYGKDTDIIIMSWAYMDDIAYRVLQAMREVNPNCVMIYIGEWEGGCTADDSFFESLIGIEDDKFDEAVSGLQRWDGIHDFAYLIK
jgi:hypothetical protein